ncbi:hypothetical protein AMTRI_Chr07g30460 [Amborella trichopoda]|uniref:Uncharacterized protein n=1 Tax=Amborella trichopoda TaxID=13333 RepID=W1NIR1_AMBTC|nr:uncharacterized protein LOC18423024 [Amborella trichopoda]XP_011625097.1 uncharacterized protein LOC18423024 [Amborella trichopoda]XP_011625099.1 uncharacterized protein LOC18423024 [Amborella trichopoda]XP_020527442.1 uncharacterized protein LOC18423024 [Amborella trichopoda]ERM95060.1 hypothetical protein AMTR_s00009p00248720 [Amborella trichopoda]|eukprot:XP_006827644.1 uncharacterized protein LOC18423024 [Amborella trichopoda]
MEEEGDLEALKSQLHQLRIDWQQELDKRHSLEEALESKITEVKVCVSNSERKESEILWRRVKTANTLLAYLRSKARIMAIPHLAHTSCGIRHQEGVGYIDKDGTPLTEWSKGINLSHYEGFGEENWLKEGSLGEHDGEYVAQIMKSVMLVTDVMESLVKRVIIAEGETSTEREKVSLTQEEIKKKAVQIESMALRVEEMGKLAMGTNAILRDMQMKLEEMERETSRQRQRASENEQELSRVRQEFENLRSSVRGLISVRETLLSSERQFQTMEKLFERLIAKTTLLESMNMQNEAEVWTLLKENDRLVAQLDLKEAQLVAMKEQCKIMAMGKS